MKDTKESGTEKNHDLWQRFTLGIKGKLQRKNISVSDRKNNVRDMGDTHSPIFGLDLTGMNREQAKAFIGKVIDEKLEKISHIELMEPKIDEKERERLKANAEERILARRKRQQEKEFAQAQIVAAEQKAAEEKAAAEKKAAKEQLAVERKTAEEKAAAERKAAEQMAAAERKAAEEKAAAEKKAAEEKVAAEKKAAEQMAAAEKKAAEEKAAAEKKAAFHKRDSIFDLIKPEPFPYEDNKPKAVQEQMSVIDERAASEELPDKAETINIFNNALTAFKSAFYKSKGRLDSVKTFLIAKNMAVKDAAIKEKSAAAEIDAKIKEAVPDQDLFKPKSFDLFGIFTYSSEGAIGEKQAGSSEAELAAMDPRVSTALDEAVDKLFAFYEKCADKTVLVSRKFYRGTTAFFGGKVLPGMAAGMGFISKPVLWLFGKIESKIRFKKKAGLVLAALSAKENAAAGKMAIFVDKLDKINESFILKVIAIKNKLIQALNWIGDFAHRHRKALVLEACGAVVVVIVVTISIGNATAYEYVYNGKVLGVVKNQQDVYKTIDIIGDKLSVQYAANIVIDKEKDIRFNKIVAFNQELDDQEDILNRLTYMQDMKANAKGLYVDGKLMATLESEKTANAILQEIKDTFLKNEPGIQYEKIGFAENIEIKDIETKLGNIEQKDKVLEYMLTGAVEERIHVVQSGETFSEIAKKYGMQQTELMVSNPDVIPEKLHIGQALSLNQIVPLVTVQTTEVAQYIEEIPYEIEYENTGLLFKDEQTVKSKGIKGQKDVVAEIIRNNGIEVGRTEVSATILSEPVSQVVLVGTKELPPLIGTGTFQYPVRGTLTSRYGQRWGRLHAGIDLAAPTGTKIRAADGGVVTFAGYNGQLGYMVEIDHGGNRVTWYGHCSKLHVKKGDKVYQGQHIADVGNTGRSTGPHLHFEVHINGKTKNPLDYL